MKGSLALAILGEELDQVVLGCERFSIPNRESGCICEIGSKIGAGGLIGRTFIPIGKDRIREKHDC